MDKVIEICEGLEGTCMTTFEGNFIATFEREPTPQEVDYAEKYMAQQGIVECECCGWWTNDMAGMNGELCSQCEDDLAADEEEDD